MSTMAPTWQAWGLPEVYNITTVRADHWRTWDLHLGFLAAVRHLMMPVAIGRPLGPVFCDDPFGGRFRFTTRVPAYTQGIAIAVLGQIVGLPINIAPAPPGVRFELSLGGGPWGTENCLSLIGYESANPDIDTAKWVSTNAMSAADAPVQYEPFPLAPTWQAQQQEADVRMDTDSGHWIFALHLQSGIADERQIV